MLVLPQEIETTWATSNREWYISKGYKFTKIRDKLKVSILDLSLNSNVKVKIRCDYCNKVIDRYYCHYLSRKEKCCVKKDACKSCTSKKKQEIYRIYVKEELFPQIRKAFENREYKLLSNYEDYKNDNSKLCYICPMHEEKGALNITWANFKSGKGCKFCGRERTNKSIQERKLEFDFVKEEFENRGYVLLETKYINNSTKMKYICPHHPEEVQSIHYNNLKNDRGCKYCGFEKRNAKISGENHPNWAGGKTELLQYLRNNIIDWKIKSLKKYNYKCGLTGINSKDLQVHHLYGFSYIFDQVRKNNKIDANINISSLSKNELSKIENEFFELHDKYGLGVPLLSEIHKLFHIEYGYGDNTPEQFEEFKIRYKNGEFNHLLNERGDF